MVITMPNLVNPLPKGVSKAEQNLPSLAGGSTTKQSRVKRDSIVLLNVIVCVVAPERWGVRRWREGLRPKQSRVKT